MTDLAERFTQRFLAMLGVDQRWVVRREHGFTWWGYWLSQDVETGPVFHIDDLAYCLVRIQTTIARHVDAVEAPAGLLARLNRGATLSALIWNPHAGTIIESCTAIVTTVDLEQTCRLLHVAGALQADSAHRRGLQIAQACNAQISLSNHPGSGERPDPDPLLAMPDEEIADIGAQPSLYLGRFGAALGEFGAGATHSASFDRFGLHCEVPAVEGRPPGIGTPAADVRMRTDVSHERVGNGVLTLLHLPGTLTASGAAVLSNHLNGAAAHGGVGAPLLGAWCVDPNRSDRNPLTFCSFLPNVLACPGLLGAHLLVCAAQARFALTQLGIATGPDTPPAPPPDHHPDSDSDSDSSTGELPHDIH